jgi:outer membrane protein assembly factor BamB
MPVPALPAGGCLNTEEGPVRGIQGYWSPLSPRQLAGITAVAVPMLLCGIPVLPAASAAAATAPHPVTAPHSVTAPRPATAPRPPAAGSAAFNWPEFHRSPSLRGYAPNSPVTAANAATLGVRWDTGLYGAALDSPVVAFDAALGKTLAYVGTEQGDMLAVNVANGQIVWSVKLGAPIRTTPVVSAGFVYAGTFNSARIYKLNASTGAVSCSVASPMPIEGTPVVATPPGGVSTLYVGTNDSVRASGPLLAIKTSDCKLAWSFTGYGTMSGAWDAVAYTQDHTGRPLILFGTADPDSAVYALNAVTGAKVWRFAVDNPAPGVFDIGAGVTVSAPGVNGFADGVAYVPSKLGIMYALDLTTGTQLWKFDFNSRLGAHEGGRSTAALVGTDLVFGYSGGLVDLDAVHGTMRWSYQDPSGTEALSSPAVIGPVGSAAVAVGDLGGGFDVVSLASGSQLYHYQTGNYITASPAVSNGDILITSADGFLYDFGLSGGNDASLPSTAITSPADFSSVANPGGSLTVKGTAHGASDVAGVVVAVQASGPSGPWWDAASHSWVSGPVGNPATLASPGATSTSWTFSYPVPAAGGTFVASAYAVAPGGQADIHGARNHFAVLAGSGPHLAAASKFVAPAGTTTVSGTGFGKSEKVTISLLGQTLAKATTTAKGAIPTTKVPVPAGTVFGQTSLIAKGATSGRSASAAITIANSWDQLGFGHGHTGFEPNDNTLNQLVHAGKNLFLDPAWQYQSGASIKTAPAVADSVAYAANAAGQLTAVDVHDGAPLWTWQDPSNAALDGSPAVDPVKRLVFVGGNDGTLDAISIASGKLAWSKTVGGHVSAPVTGGGKVYVTTSTGKVEAVAETTGAKAWSVSTGTAISAAPSLETGSSTLVVTESSGSVLGLASGTGATHWTFHSGGAVAAPAALLSGVVYFGSADGSVYALHETTGTKIWSFKTGGPVTATPALTNEGTPGNVLEVVAGSRDGNVYMLKASTGATLERVGFGQPIIGVAALHGIGIIDTSTGDVGAVRTYTNLNLWLHNVGSAISSPPAVVDGTVYITTSNGALSAFTSYGQLPDTALPLR